MTQIRCGDHVRHIPSGQVWVVAYVDGDRLAWCGWPAGEAPLANFKRVKECSDADHRHMLKQCAASDGKRQRRAADALKALDEVNV